MLISDKLVTPLGAVLLLLLTWSAISTLRQYLRLRHFKGPFGTGLSKWWLVRAVGGGRTHLDLYEACEKYGSIARVGPDYLITSDPDLMKRMLNVRTPYKRSDWYNGMRLDASKDNVLSMRDDDLHAKLRSKMAAGYSGKEVENLEAKIDQNVLRLIDLLETKYAATGKPFDFGRKAQYFTLDVITDLAFGTPFGDVASDSDVYEYIRTQEENMPGIIVSTVLPWMLTILSSPLFKSMLPSDKDLIGIGKTMAIAKKVAAERFGPDRKVQKDMLGSFVSRGLTQAEAESEILMQLLAGSDTTATAVRATLLHVITNARVTNSLRAEIEAAKPSWPVITDAEARGMPYLQAIIKEGLRIWPPVVGLMAKEVPKGGDVFKGQYLPEGTRIGYCAWGIFRRTDIWGEDAQEYRPERWLEDTPEKLREMEGTLELVFGYGRWQCLGKNVALMELNKVFVEVTIHILAPSIKVKKLMDLSEKLLRRFDLVVVDPLKPWHSINTGIFLQSEFWMKAYPRPNAIKASKKFTGMPHTQ